MVHIEQSDLTEGCSPLTFVLLSGIQIDSHFPVILLGKPFYGKCLHYLIMAHCSLREYPLRFLLVPQLKSTEPINPKLWIPRTLQVYVCNSTNPSEQSFIICCCGKFYVRKVDLLEDIYCNILDFMCLSKCSERKANCCIVVHLGKFLRGSAVCLKMLSASVVLCPFIRPLWTAKRLPAGSSCVAGSWESSHSCCPCFWQKGVHTLVPVPVTAVCPLTDLSDLSRSCWWNLVLWKLALWAPW